MISVEKNLALTAGDAVWVATAMLHREHPKADDFTVDEIVSKVRTENLTSTKEGTVYHHANWHCVANRPPNDAKLRMLYETSDGRRRLFCSSDVSHHERNGRVTPKQSEMPSELWPLLVWHQEWCAKRRSVAAVNDPLLALAGTANGIWPEDAVKYVNRLRAE